MKNVFFAISKVHGPEQGSALVIALVMLLVLTMMALAGMQTTSLQEKMAGNMRDKGLALQAAEAALREGEAFLQAAVLPSFYGTDGLYQPLNPASNYMPLWATIDWASDSVSWEYEGQIKGVAVQPRYIIEELPPVPESGGSLAPDDPIPDAGLYRVTARAVGGTDTAVVILQTIYKR